MADESVARAKAIITELAPGVVLVEVQPDAPRGFSMVLVLEGEG